MVHVNLAQLVEIFEQLVLTQVKGHVDVSWCCYGFHCCNDAAINYVVHSTWGSGTPSRQLWMRWEHSRARVLVSQTTPLPATPSPQLQVNFHPDAPPPRNTLPLLLSSHTNPIKPDHTPKFLCSLLFHLYTRVSELL